MPKKGKNAFVRNQREGEAKNYWSLVNVYSSIGFAIAYVHLDVNVHVHVHEQIV